MRFIEIWNKVIIWHYKIQNYKMPILNNQLICFETEIMKLQYTEMTANIKHTSFQKRSVVLVLEKSGKMGPVSWSDFPSIRGTERSSVKSSSSSSAENFSRDLWWRGNSQTLQNYIRKKLIVTIIHKQDKRDLYLTLKTVNSNLFKP